MSDLAEYSPVVMLFILEVFLSIWKGFFKKPTENSTFWG